VRAGGEFARIHANAERHRSQSRVCAADERFWILGQDRPAAEPAPREDALLRSGKIRRLSAILETLRREPEFQSFVSGASRRIPASMIERTRRDLGALWDWLPDKSLSYESQVLSSSHGVTGLSPNGVDATPANLGVGKVPRP
jgi:hypothetical protein